MACSMLRHDHRGAAAGGPRAARHRPAQLAEPPGLSVPTIQRMEASEGVIRGNVDSLMKLIAALDAAGIELIARGRDQPGRRPRRAAEAMTGAERSAGARDPAAAAAAA